MAILESNLRWLPKQRNWEEIVCNTYFLGVIGYKIKEIKIFSTPFTFL